MGESLPRTPAAGQSRLRLRRRRAAGVAGDGNEDQELWLGARRDGDEMAKGCRRSLPRSICGILEE